MNIPYAVLATPLAAFTGDTSGDLTKYKDVIDTVKDTLSNANITTVLEYAAGIAIVMVFTWWAVRKVSGIVKRAFMRGKLRF